MKKTTIQRCVFLLLAGAVLAGALAWPSVPLDVGIVVTEDLDVVSGREDWLRFYRAAQAGRPASVHFTRRYLADETLLRPENVTYEETLAFDGGTYTISGTTGGEDDGPWEYTFPYLLCFPDVPPPSPTSRFVSSTHYVLTDDDALTWGDIWRSRISSSTKDFVRCNIVYSEYVWREGTAPQH